jgi:hypothetical protein
MAFGSLASLKPLSSHTNYTLYTAPSSTLTEGKVYVVNRSSFPIRFNVGLSSSTATAFQHSGYLVFKKEIAPGESFESENIYVSDEQSIIVNSEETDITFTFLGKESALTFGGYLGGLNSTKTTSELLYTAPLYSGYKYNGTIFACNRNAFPVKIRVSIGTTADYIDYEYEINPFETFEKKNIRLYDGQTIRCKTSELNTNFVYTAGPESESSGGGFGNVAGIDTTGTSIFTNINATGIVTANSFVGNGSGLTGIVTYITSGSGISVDQNSGSITISATGGMGGGESYWISNVSGIHTTSNVGIGTTDPTVPLFVVGDAEFTGVVTATRFSSETTGTPTIDSATNLNLNAVTVAISTDLTVGGDAYLGVDNSTGLILTSPNGTTYRVIVDNSGNLTTTLVP